MFPGTDLNSELLRCLVLFIFSFPWSGFCFGSLDVQYIFMNNSNNALTHTHRLRDSDAHYLLGVVPVFFPPAAAAPAAAAGKTVCEISPGKSTSPQRPGLTQINLPVV